MEKKLYELLGVNLFRKYVLFNFEKFLFKFFKYKIHYRIDKFNIESIKEYKKIAYGFALAHGIILIFFNVKYGPHVSLGNIINLYCIMVQRYNIIRINELVEKYNKRERNNTYIAKEKKDGKIKGNEKNIKLQQGIHKIEENGKKLEEKKQRLLETKRNLEELKFYSNSLDNVSCEKFKRKVKKYKQ